ncbi:retrotransposon protein, putative, ty1-copia subclass [Tanacetum coccineum]
MKLKINSVYYFYYPLKNKIFVARNAEFFENSLMVQEESESHGLLESSGSGEGLELIKEEDTQPSKNTSEVHNKVAPIEVEPQNVEVPICRSARIPQAPYRYGFYVDVEEYELGDLNEPPNYKTALSYPESDKWLEAMNTEMQSIKDNQVWVLVELPPNGRTVGSKWLFKKNIVMDGKVNTFKARQVAKGHTHRDIRAIRILLAIATFYDYEIWQMDVKTAFLNGHLSEDVYMVQPEGSKRLIALSQSAYLEKTLKKFRMENSKKGYTPMIEKPDYRKSQGAQTPSEVQRMRRVSYASAIGSIMNTKDMVLVFGAKPEAGLRVSYYADASFQTDKDDTKSQTRYVFVLNGGVMDGKSAKQSTTAMSSIESEYIDAAEASMEAVWMRKFVDRLGDVVPSNKRPMEMLCDNEPTIAIANDPRILKGARHFRGNITIFVK